MDKSQKRSLTRVKSPVGRKPAAGKSPKASRSRSSGRAKKDAKVRSRSKSRTKNAARSRSRTRVKSTSPARTRSRSRRSTSRSRASSRSRVKGYTAMTEVNSDGDEISSVGSGINRKMNLVLKDVYHDDYIEDPVLKDLVRRSISKEGSYSQNSSVSRRYPSLVREASEQKEPDGLVKDIASSVSNLKLPKIPEKKKEFNFGIPKSITALFGIFIVPPFVLLLHLACTEAQCTLSKFHLHKNLNLYFNLKSGMIVIGFVVVQVLLSLLGIGRRVGSPPSINGTLFYRCNGLLSTFISAGIVAALWHYKFPVMIVFEKMVSVIVASAIAAYVLAIVLFIKGGRASVPALNPEAINENKLYQFLVGREVNPLLFGKINVKTVLLRVSLNAMVLLNGLLLWRSYEVKHELNHTLLTSVVLSTIMVLDFFWFEDSFPSTFEAMYEGTGCYLTLSYMLFPFLPALITKFIIQQRVEVPVYGLAAIIMVFFFGYFIYRASNLQKSAFRRNPLNPALAHLETISTSRGKKLLVTSWWGFVRHPNYLGSIILYWAWASTAGYTHVIPYILPLVITLVLMNRARRVDAHCKDRYQSAWEQYRNRVPHRIVPHVF